MEKDKRRLILISAVAILLLIGIALYAFMSVSKREMNLGDFIPVVIPLIIIIFMAFFIVRRYRDIKQGMPPEDERSRKVMVNAASKSFYVSLYWLLLISWLEPFFARVLFGTEKLDASQTVGGAIAGMAVCFFLFWFYYDRKGKLV